MKSFFSGLFWGAVFGGLAGLMNAPKSGQETREEIKLYLDQTTADINDVRFKVDNLSQAIQRLSGEGLDSLKSAKEDIEISIQQFTDQNMPKVDRIKQNAEQLQVEIQDNLEDI